MPSTRKPWTLRAAALLATGAAVLGTGLTPSSSADLQSQLNGARSAAASLKAQIASDSAQIASTNGGLAQAQARLSTIQSQLDARVAELRTTQNNLIAARDRLIDLENQLHAATIALSANLVASYEGQRPDLVNVVLNSHGFSQLLDQVGFLQRVANHNADIVGTTRTARAQVSREATNLEGLETRDRALADQVLGQRNEVAALQAALQRRQLDQLAQRSRASGQYAAMSGQINSLQNKLEAQERAAAQAAVRAAQTGNANVGGIAVNTSGMVQPPAGAPEAVRQIIAAGNAIATLPYIWGGGHGSFQASGYDCSGSVSYALAAAGLLSAPEVSGDFETFGDAGPGQWVTIYANADHVWMEVAGWRFDTVALAETGSRWTQGGGEFDGFVVRHPAGL